MSWQATAWALHQKVGHCGRKLLLLAIANYADEHGYCWPSQRTLSEHAEMSLDTVQRQTKKLITQGLISVTRAPKRRGQWQTFHYQLNMSDAATKPQKAATPEIFPPATGNPYLVSADCGLTRPHRGRKPSRIAVRLKPSIEPSIEPSIVMADERSRASANPPTANPHMDRSTKATTSVAERLKAFQAKQEPTEVTQNRIAQRLGGWEVLMRMTDRELEHITALERRRQLDDGRLYEAVLRSMSVDRS
ncbi:helix-turn-helix domain-containing protein [Bradyrhizobium sp. JR3.5]